MKKHQVTKEMIGKVINRRKFEWVDREMRKHIPNRVYQAMRRGNTAEKEVATEWIKEKGYHVIEEDGFCRLKRGDTVIASCRIVLELDTPEDLGAIAEAVGIPSNWKGNNGQGHGPAGIIVP